LFAGGCLKNKHTMRRRHFLFLAGLAPFASLAAAMNEVLLEPLTANAPFGLFDEVILQLHFLFSLVLVPFSTIPETWLSARVVFGTVLQRRKAMHA